MSEKPHIPVMLDEVIKYLNLTQGKIYCDCTFGAGGYSKAILNAADCRLIALDQDPNIKIFAEEIAKNNPNFHFIQGNFGDIAEIFTANDIGKIDGIVFDLGVSSMQLDQRERGFSFLGDAPLDMRMSASGKSAFDFVNYSDEKTIADIIFNYGDEKRSRAIARNIVAARKNEPINTTMDLVRIIHRTIGPVTGKIDSATRTFQAIRIWVNDELEMLERALESTLQILNNGARIVVVSFHSLEDRIVKNFFNKHAGKVAGVSRYVPITKEQPKPKIKLITKAIAPQDLEIRNNIRARSAKMRVAEILPFDGE
jgi:16S rRNA (cytosine1402-N4)-methyltransferase